MRFAITCGCAQSTTVESNGGRSRSFGNAGTLLPRNWSINSTFHPRQGGKDEQDR